MIFDLIIAMFWSLSPFGESKVGIPYGIGKGVNSYVVFVACFLSNLLVFPMMMFFLENVNKHLTKWRPYKKSALFVARRAKTGTADKVQKYGFFGLVLFVMIPLPGTGVYAGSIASYLLKIEKKKAFLANALGIFLSSLIIYGVTVVSVR
ncbi:ligand-binding protein SH3 [Flagellimonas olearia]|uniref:Ligand-binding protein SH3 n=1 Tax=Flagellimonas olearia TaxID=552546 RepID=A0A6I1DWV2_9FLAO|nr:small multi-drug export protein [Allomuricauda olearia]KAB7528524.1 ligand-binding protein SH3 [Allomuricauda olearia]